MASYKLIQDVEADDKLLGPLSFRQFIFALFAVFLLYISYVLYSHHAGILDAVTVPLALIGGFFAYPFGKDQPTEIWAIAKLSFLLKPRRRVWAQSGINELVTITVPKKVEIQRTDGLSQTEVKSRLQALANTIDSRGWAIKNVYQNPLQGNDESDRLINVSTIPKDVPEYEAPSDDMFDDSSNAIAHQFKESLLSNSAAHRQGLMDSLSKARADMSATPEAPPLAGQIIHPSVINNSFPEAPLTKDLEIGHPIAQTPLNNMHVLRQKIAEAKTKAQPDKPKVTPQSHHPVIMDLSKVNGLNIDVLSREVDRALGNNKRPNEVEVALR